MWADIFKLYEFSDLKYQMMQNVKMHNAKILCYAIFKNNLAVIFQHALHILNVLFYNYTNMLIIYC